MTENISNSSVSFELNGQKHVVPNNVHPATRLSDYIRQVAQLKGTKVMCREGGCGVCIVTVQYMDHVTNTERTRAINSCLCPVYIARGWKITTTEGLGRKQTGFHPIQQRMADHSATQCGYCTPGFVLSMYGLLKENPAPSVDEVLKSIDSNLCRCTGYRSIVDALTSFSKDGKNAQPIDIEDLQNLTCVSKQNCKHKNTPVNTPVIFKNWQRPQTLDELYSLLKENAGKRNRLVFGNTASGVYKKDRYDMYFDIREIPDLYKVEMAADTLEVGSSLTLSDLQEVFSKYQGKDGFNYLEKLSDHIDLIGHKAVRNSGTWAGNLMLKHTHPEFLADMLPPLEALKAKIVIGCQGDERCITPQALMKEEMSNKVILSVRLPALGDHETFAVYKTMLRRQSAHGYITAAFRISFSDIKNSIVKDASLVYEGLSMDKEFHAVTVENYLQGKSLASDQVKSECLLMLSKDISVAAVGLSTVEYRTHLAQNILFKFLCEFSSNGRVTPPARLQRPPVSSKQDYETFPEQYPITQPMPKLSATLQTSGEAVFLDDIPVLDNELSALIVLSTIGKGKIENIDTSAALSVPGVVDVVTAADIPGKNDLNPVKVLAVDQIEYNGQPVAVILAEDLSIAYRAVGLVRVTYKDVERPIVDLEEAVDRGDVLADIPSKQFGDTQAAMPKCSRIIEGKFKHGFQYHFYVENQGCFVVPHEDRYEVWSSNQYPALIQSSVADTLGIHASSVLSSVPRVGGGFGGKIGSSGHFAALAALGAAKTNRPVRLNPSLETCMKVSGHRPSMMATYKAGVDNSGMIQAMEMKIYWNAGHKVNFVIKYFADSVMGHCDGVYHFTNMHAQAQVMKTDVTMASAMRSPGQLPAHLLVETMMDHVAHEIGADPIALRQKHLCKQGEMMLFGAPMTNNHTELLWQNALVSADVHNRQKNIENFNKENKWVKRGIAMTPGKFLITYAPSFTFTVYLAVYHHDGSVVISHGGVEFGQGLDIKAAQITVKMLGIPQDLIKIVRCNTLTAPNSAVTAGSQSSEYICRTIEESCKTLLKKLEPIRAKHPDADWKKLVSEAHMAGVHMAVTEKYISPTKNKLDYTCLGVLVAEAEVDVLTGESQILRADLHSDIGRSVNPAVDVGQMEGALVIGLGMMLREREVMDPETGRLLTASTWDYKPPTALDIPADLRVSFLKDKPNTVGVFSCKALGEPPMCTTPAFLFAAKAAIAASRSERGKNDYVHLYAPATPAVISKALDVTHGDLA